MPESDLAHLFTACVDLYRAAGGEAERRLENQRAHVLSRLLRFTDADEDGPALLPPRLCHGCVPGGASVRPLCDAVVLADQWVHVRHVRSANYLS